MTPPVWIARLPLRPSVPCGSPRRIPNRIDAAEALSGRERILSTLTVTGPPAIPAKRVGGSRGSSDGLPNWEEGAESTWTRLYAGIPAPAVVALGWVRWTPDRHDPWRSVEAGAQPREWTRWGNALQMLKIRD